MGMVEIGLTYLFECINCHHCIKISFTRYYINIYVSMSQKQCCNEASHLLLYNASQRSVHAEQLILTKVDPFIVLIEQPFDFYWGRDDYFGPGYFFILFFFIYLFFTIFFLLRAM